MKRSIVKNGFLALALTSAIITYAVPTNNTISIKNHITTTLDKISITIDKNTTDSDFKTITNTLKKHYITVKFTNIKRNKNNEIIAIKINLKDEDGNKSATLLKSNKPIDDIILGSDNGTLFIISKSSNSFSFKSTNVQSKHFDFNFDDDANTLTLNGKTINFDEISKKLKAVMSITEDENGKLLTIQLNDINFSLDENEDTYSKKSCVDIKKPVYYIDDRKATKKEVDALKPDRIEKINILKNEKAVAKYGKNAENGVVEIILHDNSPKFRFIDDPSINKYIVIDGKKANFKKLDALAKSNQLSSVDFLKPETAMSLYGKKAKDGAIIATTKK